MNTISESTFKRTIANYEKTIALLEHQIKMYESANEDLKQRIKLMEQANILKMGDKNVK